LEDSRRLRHSGGGKYIGGIEAHYRSARASLLGRS
jgi:hypothetical protein